MNRVTVFYNPFLPELRVSVNGKKVSPYSPLMSLKHQRISTLCDTLLDDIHHEIHADYELVCQSSEFACRLMEALALADPHCMGYTPQPLPLDANVYERLAQLELLGGERVDTGMVIPVLDARGDRGMAAAMFEILTEDGVFSENADLGVVWEDCPLTSIELRPARSGEDIPRGAPLALVLSSHEDNECIVDTDVPVYVLVMGSETRFLKKRNNYLYFTIDSDAIGETVLQILEEEALCPLLSRLSYEFPADAQVLMTDREKEALQLICRAAPVAQVTFPHVCDVGRNVTLPICVYPSDSEVDVRLLSDCPEIIEAVDRTLCPRTAGTADISLYVGDDPYPAATGTVMARKRVLMEEIKLFPATLCMPERETRRPDLTVIPANADNVEELVWESDDPTVATVDAHTGDITAKACGRCTISVRTPDTSARVALEVQPALEEIRCPGSFVEVGVGDRKEWRYTVIPPHAYESDMLRAVSTDPGVAEYRGGYVVGNGAGECKIYIKNPSGSVTTELRVTVKKNRKFW